MRLLIRAWRLGRTKLLWRWRFGAIGPRSTVGRCRTICNPGAVSFGHHTTVGDDWSFIDLQPDVRSKAPKIRIGSYCSILHDFQCNAKVSVEIQDYVLIAPRVFVTDSDHVVEDSQKTTLCKDFHSAPVVIEHNCWLGVNAVILKGVTIGHHSVIGANAVVTRDVPAFSRVAGVPARPVSPARLA